MAFIGRFLSGYTENFLLAVALWPLASMALTLPILAWLYHRDGRLRFGSAVSTYLAVLYVLGLGCFTLWPLPSGDSGLGITYGIPWQLDPLAFVWDFAREGVRTLPQIAFNVVLFMPLGFIAGRLLRWGFLQSVIVGFLASLLIESAQGTGLFGVYPYAYRTADVDDLIYNTAGAMAGWACSAALARALPPGALAEDGEVTHSPGFVHRCVALWLDTLLASLVSVTATAGIALALYNIPGSEQWTDGSYSIWVSIAAFLWVECVHPWRHGGSTPGGTFVRMSCETQERHGARRVAFFAVRAAVLGTAFLFLPSLWPLLAIFYLFVRKMPYDFV
ncbi:MAG: VanZ family protein [Collinsella sp.]|nr:VanZ family protein [Collinsella sp.]